MEPTKLDYLVMECFCIHNNSGFKDILNEYDGKPVTPEDRFTLKYELATELLDFAKRQNKADLISHNLAFKFARAELIYRIDYDTNMFQMYSFLDDVRWDLILSQDS